MKLLFVIACLALVQLKFIESKSIRRAEEPRIFFRQILDASGLFPIEINVPDTISTMMSGLSTMYDSVSSYFGSGSESGGQPEMQVIIHDENNVVSKMTQATKAKRKVKRSRKNKKKWKQNDNDYDYISYFFL